MVARSWQAGLSRTGSPGHDCQSAWSLSATGPLAALTYDCHGGQTATCTVWQPRGTAVLGPGTPGA